MKSIITIILSIVFFWSLSKASTDPAAKDPARMAKDYIYAHLNDWDLSADDVADIIISDMYTDKSSGITRVYFLQRYKGIPVFNAILNVCMTKEGKVYYTTSRFVKSLEEKINATKPKINAAEAIGYLTTHLGFPSTQPRMKMCTNDAEYIFEQNEQTREDITVELNYQPYQGKVNLAWTILYCPFSTLDQWNVRVDAVTGEVLKKDNWTLYCNVD